MHTHTHTLYSSNRLNFITKLSYRVESLGTLSKYTKQLLKIKLSKLSKLSSYE